MDKHSDARIDAHIDAYIDETSMLRRRCFGIDPRGMPGMRGPLSAAASETFEQRWKEAKAMALSSEDLRKFLDEELGVDTADVEDDSELFSSGVIDSTALVLLIAFIEESCGFELSPMDVTLENLDTIDRILEFTAAQES